MFTADKKRSYPDEKLRFLHGETLPKASSNVLRRPELRVCKKWGVITTIFTPSEAVGRFTYLTEWCLVIVADKEKPESYIFHTTRGVDQRVVFLTAKDQENIGSEFVKSLPWHSFGRKNVGYLFAVANGAEVIFDFDDDNMLKFWIQGATTDTDLWIDKYADMNKPLLVRAAGGKNLFFNPYPCLNSPADIWPRGFPLSLSRNHCYSEQTVISEEKIDHKTIGVLQSTADHSPDVDAVLRLVANEELEDFAFQRPPSEKYSSLPLFLEMGTYSPYNAQATLHFSRAFHALYLPVTVAGRVSDIWRSYVAQAIFSITETRWGFLPRPLVVQDRNPHSNMADFSAEIPLYTQVEQLINFLEKWTTKMKSRVWTFEKTVENLWVELFERGFVEAEDVTNMQLWLIALSEVGYKFPQSGHGRSFKNTSKSNQTKSSTLNFVVGKSIAATVSNERPKSCNNIEKYPRGFWTADMHDGTRLDTASVLASLGQNVVVAGTKGNSSPFGFPNGIQIKDAISDSIKKYIYHSHPITNSSIKATAAYVAKKAEVFSSVNAFYCSFPAAMCELWLDTDKAILFLAAHRYNLGRCSVEE